MELCNVTSFSTFRPIYMLSIRSVWESVKYKCKKFLGIASILANVYGVLSACLGISLLELVVYFDWTSHCEY